MSDSAAVSATDDPIADALSWLRYDTRTIVNMVVRLVRYEATCVDPDGKPICSIDRFRQLLGLAILDTFTDEDETAKVGRLVGPGPKPSLSALRKDGLFATLCDKVRQEMAFLANVRTMDDLAERYEARMALEGIKVALFTDSAREKLRAASEIVDRRSAKKGRDVGPGGIMVLPPDFARALAAAYQQSIGTGGGVGIDGSVLNVPVMKKIGSGTTGGGE